MKYYCYISDSKINNLYSQLDEGMVDEIGVTHELNSDAELETSDKASILSLLGVDIKFGIEGRLQYAQNKKIKLAQKLKKVLNHLEKDNKISNIKKIKKSSDLFFYYNGSFYFDDSPLFKIDRNAYADGIAILSSDLGESISCLSGYKLQLACSASNFSDTRANGKYQLNSANYHFFENSSVLKFETVFVVNEINKNKKTIYGSPLFLALENEGARI